MKRSLAGAMVLLATLLLAGCGVLPTPTTTSTPDLTGVPAALRGLYGQRLVWTSCGDGVRCATASAPLDWAKPAGPRIRLALTMHAATGERRGTLFTNPGGPGASGTAFLKAGVSQSFDRTLVEHDDIVAWDPRGTGESQPVDCYGTAGLDRFLYDDPDLPEGSARLRQDLRSSGTAFGRACASRTGALLGHVSTEDTVRDLDLLRAVVGSAKLDYLGFSYGTYIGALYANTFPTHVGRMVLDGAVDPSTTSFQENLANTAAFGAALKAYLTDCLRDQSCPFRGLGVDGAVDRLADLINEVRASPVREADGREVNGAVLRTAIEASLYNERSWPTLSSGIGDLESGDGAAIQGLADQYYGRTASGYRSNLVEAYFAVTCLDKPVTTDPAAVRQEGEQLDAADPLRAADNSNDVGATVCGNWPIPPTGRVLRVTATGAPPILVLGNTGDPATPYAWARSVAGQLPGAVLLTLRGEGHLSYPQGVSCINDRVDRFLVEGTLPGAVTCG